MRNGKDDEFLFLTPDLDEVLLEKINKERRRKLWISNLVAILISSCIAYILFGVVFGVALVDGNSMAPAYKDGDLVMFSRIPAAPKTGDVILVKTEEFGKNYVKRVVGLPGQTIDIDMVTGEITINGKAIAEPYIYQRTEANGGVEFPLILDSDEYFVLGDNRGNSKDSRYFGPVTSDSIVGHVFAVFRTQK